MVRGTILIDGLVPIPVLPSIKGWCHCGLMCFSDWSLVVMPHCCVYLRRPDFAFVEASWVSHANLYCAPCNSPQPMGQTIPPNSHICKPTRLDTMAGSCLSSIQQQEKHHHQTIVQSNPSGIWTPTNPWSITTLKQWYGQRVHQKTDRKQRSSHQGHQWGSKRKWNNPRTISHWRSSLAERKELEVPPSSHQTQSEMLWTLQGHQRDFSSGVSTPTVTIIEYPPCIPCIPLITLLQNSLTQPKLLPTTTWPDWWWWGVWSGTDKGTPKLQ